MASADKLWQELRGQGGPSARNGASLTAFAGLPGVASHVRTYDKNKRSAHPQAPPSFIAQLGRQPGPGQASYDAGGVVDALLASLQRQINALSDPDRSTRRQAVERLHAALLGASANVAPETLQALVTGPVLAPMVRLLADPAEKCRELATAFLAGVLPRLPQPEPLVTVLVPAVAERVGSLPVKEESEEMRLALAELVAGALLACAPRPLPDSLLHPLCATVCCQLRDAYADIKKVACLAVASVAGQGVLPAPLLELLVRKLLVNLAHQHSRVRLASLQALHALVQHGMPLGLMQEHIVPSLRPLSHDHATAVRAALFSFAAHWAGSQLASGTSLAEGDGRAANQCRSFSSLLLPLLLLGLTDEAESIRTAAYEQLEAIAAFLTVQAPSRVVSSTSRTAVGKQLPGYCHPFAAGRPSLAARRMVQAQLGHLLQQCLAELQEWTATARASSVRLLRASLIFGEAEVLPQLPTVLLALRSAVSDEDAGVAMHAVGCVHVLGVNLPARYWMPLAAEGVAADEQGATQRMAALVVLAALLHAAGKLRTEVDACSLQLAVEALSTALQRAGWSAGEASTVQQQLLAACSNLLEWAGPAASCVAPQLFQAALHLWAIEQSSLGARSAAEASQSVAAPEPTAEAVLLQLAQVLGKLSAAELCEQYGLALLQAGLQRQEQWSHAHPDWHTLSALLRLSSCSALLQLWPHSLPVLSHIAGTHDRDAHLRLELFQLLVALLEDGGKADAWRQAGMGQQLVREVLTPGLAWRVGRAAAAVRYANLSALAALLANQRLPHDQLAELTREGSSGVAGNVIGAAVSDCLLARVTGCIDEDYGPDTRQLACHVLELLLDAVGASLSGPQLSALLPELLKRLDDSSNGVRVAACATLQAWLRSALVAVPHLVDSDASSLAGSMLLHLGDPDRAVSEAVCGVLDYERPKADERRLCGSMGSILVLKQT